MRVLIALLHLFRNDHTFQKLDRLVGGIFQFHEQYALFLYIILEIVQRQCLYLIHLHFLNSVNFSVETPTINISNEKSTELNARTLFAAESRLKQKINDLLINYDNFSNFINFSSAELRTKIAKNKILKLN